MPAAKGSARTQLGPIGQTSTIYGILQIICKAQLIKKRHF
jgi:hypothetical protein